MIKTRGRKLLTAFAATLMAVALVLTGGLIGSHGFNKSALAKTEPTDTVIDLTLDTTSLAPQPQGGKMFSGEGLAKLYDAILGTKKNASGNQYTGTYNKVKEALTNSDGTTTQTWTSLTNPANTTTIPNAIDAADIRTNNGANVVVKIGSTEFQVVYVTLNNSGDVIVDLWQSSSTQVSPWAANSAGSPGYSPYNGRNNGASTRPSNVYGNSYIRAMMLGQGGTWDQFSGQNSGSSAATATAGNSVSATYGALWNSMTNGDLSSFIDEPSKVRYQEVESYSAYEHRVANGSSGTGWWQYTMPGDAYGTPFDEWYHDGSTHFWNSGVNTGYGGNGTNPITGQDQWKNDKIWLPSYTETGHNGVDGYASSPVSGLWNLDNAQRNNNGGSTPSSWTWTTTTPNLSWLRSGSAGNAYSAFFLASSGSIYNYYVSSSFAVRPALHLNLKSAALSAASGSGSNAADYIPVNTPQDLTFTYNGVAFDDLAKIVEWVEGGDANIPNLSDALTKDTIKGNTGWFDTLTHALNKNSVQDSDKYFHTQANGSTPAAALMYKIEYTQGSTDASGVSTSGETAQTLTKFELKNAGVYKITCKFEPTSKYRWRDPASGAISSDATKTFNIVIKQKKAKYEWKSKDTELHETDSDPKKQWTTPFALNFIPKAGALANTSKAPWPYISYELLNDPAKSILDDSYAENQMTYTWDSVNSKHVVKVAGKDDKTLPCIVVKFVSVENYENDIEHIFANKDPKAKGEKYPQQAGNYRAEAVNVNEKTGNYELVAKDTTTTMNRSYVIDKLEIDTPALRDPLEYTGNWVEFEIAAFANKVGTGTDAKYYSEFVEYGNYDSNGDFVKDMMPLDDDGNDLGLKHSLTGNNKNKLVFKAHDANAYTVYYHLKTVTVENTTAYPDPIVRNYKWKCTTPSTIKDPEGTKVDGKSDDLKRVYEVAPKTLEFTFNSMKLDTDGTTWVDAKTWDIKTNDKTSKLTYDFTTGHEPVEIRTYNAATDTWDVDPNGEKEKPVLELWYYETKKGDTAAKKPVLESADDPTEFIFNMIKDADNKHTAGEYTIMIKIAAVDDTQPDTLVNANYRVKVTPDKLDGESDADYEKRVEAAYATYRQAMKLKPGEASLDDIAMQYQSDKMKEEGKLPEDLPFKDAAVPDSSNLTYAWNEDTKKPMQFFFTAGFDDIDFLELDKTYGNDGYIFSYLDADGNETATLGNGEGFAKASKVRVKFKVQVKADSRLNNKMPKASEYKDADNGGMFYYTPGTPDADGNIFDGELTFEYEIAKATVDADALKDMALQYQFTGETKWQTYDPKNPPEYNDGKSITFRPDPDKLPQGVTKAEVTKTLGDFKNPGTPTITIKVEVDANYETVKDFNLKPEISAKVIDISEELWKIENLKDSNGDTVKDDMGAPYQITGLNPDKLPSASYADYIDYEYWTMKDDGSGNFVPDVKIGVGQTAIDALIDPTGPYKASSTNAYPVFVRPVLNSKAPTTATGTPKLVLKDLSGNSVTAPDGSNGFISFNFGESKDLIVVTQNISSSVYGDSVTAGDILTLTYENGDIFQAGHYSLTVFDADKKDLGALDSFDFANAPAGVYSIAIKLTDPAMAKDFVLTDSSEKFTIEKKAVSVPTLADFEYNGSIINILDKLGGSYLDEALKQLMTVTGDVEGKDVQKDGYVAIIKLNNPNYKWDDGSADADGDKTGTKLSLLGASLASVTTEITADDTARLVWNVNPFVLKNLNWNTSGVNATLNLPENVKNILAAAGVEIGYNYYDSNGELVTELEKGKTYRVEAVLTGEGAELGNVVFEKTSEDGSTVPSLVSDRKVYESKKGIFDSALSFATKTWMGLPIWAWMLIALAILILLIIIIVVACKKRKSKEEREAIKAAKEEEKQRREEERRQKEEEREEEKRRREEERAEEKRRRDEEREEERRRREEEREEAKAKQQAELELAKAKQEAELARIKAEAAAASAMPAAAMAATALAQPQAQPQQVQQPVQQVQQVPVADNSAIAKLEAEIAMLRAENKAQQQAQQNNNAQPQQNYNAQPAADPTALARIEARLDAMQAEQRAKAAMQQPMMQMPMQMPMMPQMPMQMPMYGPMPYGGNGGMGGNGGSMNDPVMVAELTRLKAESEAHMRVELERARTETERAKADAEIAKVRAESGRYQQPQQAMYPQSPVQYAQAPTVAPVQPQAQAVQPVIQQVPVAAQANAAEGNFSAADVGAIVASMMKSMGGRKPREQKTVIEAETQPVASTTPTVYPPDAVITTTTMVDTTKKPNQSQRITREDDGRLFDIDGFYDTFDENK